MLPKELPRKKLLIFGSLVLAILLLLLISLLQQRKALNQKIMVEEQIGTQPVSEIPAPDFQTVSSPQMTFSVYNTNNASVVLPPTVKTHIFKSDYSLDALTAIGQNLGLTENRSEGNTVILYNLDSETDKGYLKFDTDSGNYEYLSYGNIKIPANVGIVTQDVKAYLLANNLIDETVDCDISYQRLDVTDATFVECHRSWEKAGLPIINFAGLLNVPDLKSIKDLQVGYVDDDTVASNPNIVNVSTGQNGMERPNDFNTITVSVDSQGNLVGINSNIKLIDTSNQYNQDQLYTPEEAIDLFRSGQTQLSLIVPADENLDWETIFPNNTALDLNGQLNDILLAYVENPFTGKSLTPMYIARGNAETAEGNSVNFLQAVPALRSDQSYYGQPGDVAGVMAQAIPTDDPTLKFNTFQPEQRTTVGSMSGESCVPAENQLSPIVSLGAYGMIGRWSIGAEGKTRAGNWYLLPANPQVLPEINSITSAFDQLQLTGKGTQLRELDKLSKEWNQYKLCPLRVSGSSPSVFIYGNGNYTLSVGRKLTYAYPQAHNSSWTVQGNSDSIYYEYQPVWFTKPETGWLIDKNTLKAFAQSTGKKLGLTSAETDKLAFELKLAGSQLAYKTLFIGIIPQTEIDQKVPLKIEPNIPVTRYHFFVSKAGENVLLPLLSPVTRTSEMVLEVGAVAQ